MAMAWSVSNQWSYFCVLGVFYVLLVITHLSSYASSFVVSRYYSDAPLYDFQSLSSQSQDLSSCKCLTKSSCVSDEAIKFVSGRIKDILAIPPKETICIDRHTDLVSLARGRFSDFTCSIDGESILEYIFVIHPDYSFAPSAAVIEQAICAMQSLLVLGLQIGIKGPPQYLDGLVQHLRNIGIEETGNDIQDIAVESRRLKFERDVDDGTRILASLMRKRNAQGEFDLLLAMGVWSKHEDLSLLRSGFPLRFAKKEEDSVEEALSNVVDFDSALGVRKDFRSMKVITIDGENTKEIDDGLSVQVIQLPDGSTKQRLWIHISDADNYAPRSSRLFQVGRRRGTSMYLPTKTYPMFPESVAFSVMSLRAGEDSCALSMGVELLPSGEIDDSSIILTTSTINVDFRLSYDIADEMFEEGVAYSEEWELGALLNAAKLRRQYRCNQGSIESIIETQLPNGITSTEVDENAEDGVSVSIEVEYSHNSGFNSSSVADDRMSSFLDDALPLSPSNLLVTEMMILAGEAMGKWIMNESELDEYMLFTAFQDKMKLSAPFRSQPKPAFLSRLEEYNKFLYLKENQLGEGYCAAWYIRRFFEALLVNEDPKPHSGLGLECYVQWSSPIRRFADLQVHAAVKRHLRAKHLNSLVWKQAPIPQGINIEEAVGIGDVINYKEGLAQMKISRRIQNESGRYWLYEYLRRRVDKISGEVAFECVVLGCIDTQRLLYVVFIHELGHEARYISQKGKLIEGGQIWLKCQNINPRMSLITWTLSSKGSGASS